MKIFITGGTGFIGANLIQLLKHSPHELSCLARKTSHIEILEEAKVNIIYGDVTDKKSVSAGMRGCDWVINLANLFELWTTNPDLYQEVNIKGTRNVMEAAIAAKVSKVVHISTGVVYGNAPWPIREDSPFGDKRATKYCESKYEGEKIAQALYENSGLPLVIISPSAVIGPNDPKAAGRYIRNISLGKLPAQVFTKNSFAFVYVKDVAQAIIKALEKENNIGEKYLLSAENHTWGEINKMISEISGKKLPLLTLPDWMVMLNSYLFTALSHITRRPPIWDMAVDQMAIMKQGFNVDGSKAERELGIKYTPIYDGIREAIESYRK